MLSSKLLLNSLIQSSGVVANCRTIITTSFNLSQKGRKALDENDLNLPIPPKKPLTAYFKFLVERKNEGRFRDKKGAAEMAPILIEEWKNTDQTRYFQEYRDEFAEYQRQYVNYMNSLTDSQRKFLENKNALAKESKILRKLRQTKPPKRPRNAVHLFCAERAKDLKSSGDMNETWTIVASRLFKEYKSMSAEEKEKYLKLQEEDRSRFKQEFNHWYDGIMMDSSLPKAVRDKAEALRTKFQTLSYI